MIIKDKDAIARMNSPLNLINQLKSNGSRKNAMSLFIPSSATRKQEEKKKEEKEGKEDEKQTQIILSPAFNPFSNSNSSDKSNDSKLTIDDLVANSEEQVKLSLAHDKALELLNRSVALLSEKLDDVRADKLPSVISATSKVVEGIRKERLDSAKQGKDREVHYHFYTPEQKKITDYNVIDVQASA